MAHGTFRVGELTAIIGDNTAHEQHRAGYNGIWSLRHDACDSSIFVPTVAGWNLEHIFDGQASDAQEVFFEPRHAPMTFRQISEHEAELHQPPTPTFFLESWTRFTLVAPYYIDVEFRCVPRQHSFRRGYIGLFWASYINAPEDKSLYFMGNQAGQQSSLWMQFCTQRHDDESTALHRDDTFELTFRDDYRDALFRNLSPMRYHLPLCYGLFENLTWIMMFDRTEGIRLSHSPSGGGVTPERQTTNPAWDFQFILPEYAVNQEYSFRARAVLRPRCSRDEVLAEYQWWHGEN